MARRQESALALQSEIEISVPFQDADPMGVTWHGNYFRYLEHARAELLDMIGYNHREMVASGYHWPIVDARIKYIKPTTYGQRLKVIATLEEYENRLKIAYSITDRVSGEVVTTAFTIQAAVSKADGEMCFCSPRALVDKVHACLASMR